jgi:hypothetical protein
MWFYSSSASDTLVGSADTERSTTSTTYVRVKSINIGGRRGTLRIKFDLKISSSSYTAYGQVYRNNEAIGTGHSTTSTSYVTFSQDISGWTPYNDAQLWYRTSGAAAAYTRNFRIYCTDTPGTSISTTTVLQN